MLDEAEWMESKRWERQPKTPRHLAARRKPFCYFFIEIFSPSSSPPWLLAGFFYLRPFYKCVRHVYGLFCFLSIQHQSRKPEIFYLNAFLKQTNGLLLSLGDGDGVRTKASIDFHSCRCEEAKKCVKVFMADRSPHSLYPNEWIKTMIYVYVSRNRRLTSCFMEWDPRKCVRKCASQAVKKLKLLPSSKASFDNSGSVAAVWEGFSVSRNPLHSLSKKSHSPIMIRKE